MKTTIVAEIGSNWEGEIGKAKKIIQGCKDAGADAVKFQLWRAEDLYSKKHPLWNWIKKSELTFQKVKSLKNFADEISIEFFCSAFYPEAIDFLESINVKRYKIASRTCTLKDPFSEEILLKVAQTKKPVIVSMGMGGNRKYLEQIFKNNKNSIFCYCISEYPLKFDKINWKKALTYGGFSDHTLGIIAPIVFTTLKKKLGSKKVFIEKHVKSINSKGPDAESSITIEELTDLVTYSKHIEKSNI